MEGSLGALAREAGLPLSLCLDERNAIASVVVAYPNEYGRALAGDEDIFFGMHSDAVPHEDGDCLVV